MCVLSLLYHRQIIFLNQNDQWPGHELENSMGFQVTRSTATFKNNSTHHAYPHLAIDPWNKSLNFIFPTKYVVPKAFLYIYNII